MEWGGGRASLCELVLSEYIPSLPWEKGLADPGSGETDLTMLGSLCPRIGLGLLLLTLVLVAAQLRPQPGLQRFQPFSVPEEVDTRELPNGLVDDYGILPKHPGPRVAHPLLSRAQKHKRDGPDLSEYDYDAHR
ncbi:uncharacterized protein C11orf94 homolog [Dromiciops gliroides]|uniref:uncharacterized protein C11orf94 homolog n=1 Tax=Dromiciops gliroides TaxID=33562 RepID=UPI001CC78308|nr:uncharacterized protein C11orf94 homolog [Dromiciops gliroides]